MLEPYADSSHPHYSYVDVPQETKALVEGLTRGVDLTRLTLKQAFDFYLKRKAKPNPVERRKQIIRYNAALQHLERVLGSDLLLINVTRRHASKVRDDLLSRNLKISTVQRYLKDIRAVLNYAALEHEIPHINPFQRLDLPKQSPAEKNHRLSMPLVVIDKALAQLSAAKSREPFLIFALLYHTGARLGEITGLLKSDLHLEDPIPYLDIQEHAHRRLKNDWSSRQIPLPPAALAHAMEALSLAPDSEFVFPRYAGLEKRGTDSASAWLNKVIRRHCPDKGVVVHSLRHNFRDRIRANEIHFETGKALEGHRYSLGEEAHYGGGISLEVLYAAISKINRDL